ncbi:hypothetical protein, partial [Nitrosomonas europaea]|uniref:hypothetical protein n=1 Tax=Nitrosomonas europaea TaxID=915 RepID=UPI002CA39AC7
KLHQPKYPCRYCDCEHSKAGSNPVAILANYTTRPPSNCNYSGSPRPDGHDCFPATKHKKLLWQTRKNTFVLNLFAVMPLHKQVKQSLSYPSLRIKRGVL